MLYYIWKLVNTEIMKDLPKEWYRELEHKKVAICTPMISGECCSAYLQSMVNLVSLLNSLNIKFKLITMDGVSVIDLARNLLTHQFLKTDADYLMFKDADMGFDPAYVPLMMFYGKDITTGPSPKKEINWDRINQATNQSNFFKKINLKYLASNYILGKIDCNKEDFSPLEMVRMDRAGTGFTLIKRKVFEELSKKAKHFYWEDSKIKIFFNISYENEKFHGEDIYFTKEAKKAGFEVWLCPWMEIIHVGQYRYVGDFKSLEDYDEYIKS